VPEESYYSGGWAPTTGVYTARFTTALRPDIRTTALDLAGNADDFVRSSGVTFPVGFDGSAEVLSGKYDLYGPPYAFFMSPEGIVVAVRASTLTTKTLLAEERRLVTS
jgi:hypothetical protein